MNNTIKPIEVKITQLKGKHGFYTNEWRAMVKSKNKRGQCFQKKAIDFNEFYNAMQAHFGCQCYM